MSWDRLPDPLEDALEAIHSATAELLDAAMNSEPAVFRGALARRAAAIELLQVIVASTRTSLSQGQVHVLEEAVREIASLANDARSALAASMERARHELENFERVASAVRRYSGDGARGDSFEQSR